MPDCSDESDEKDCKVIVLKDGYNKNIPPIARAKDGSAIPAKVNISITLIAYRIFSLYQENTKTIHSIMMIWLVSFIISNYKLASGPPKDPGGVKNIFSKSKDIDS